MILCNVSQAQSADNWIASGGGSWSLGPNWSTGSVPTANEVATIGASAASVVSPASITLDTDQTAYALVLIPGANKTIHLDPGTNPNSRLTLVHTEIPGQYTNYYTINANIGTGSQINTPVLLGTGASGNFTGTIFSADTAFVINGGLFESGATWGVKIAGKGGIVSYATTPSNYSGDTTIAANGILRLDLNNAIPNGSGKGNVVLETNGQLLFLNATAQTINGLNSTSSSAIVSNMLANNGATLTVGGGDASGTFAGQIGNPEANGVFNLVKIGSGTQRLNGILGYTGTTTVLGGTLLVNGSQKNGGNYSVSSGATLGGVGSIFLQSAASVTVTGSLAPGDLGPGVFNIGGKLNLNPASVLRIELSGLSPGNNAKSYDQLNMTDSTASISASFAHIAVSLVNGFAPKSTDIFYILTRADSGAFGAPQPFDAYPEGAKIKLGNGWTGNVTYLANWKGVQTSSTLTGGNDMGIFNVALVPEPASSAMLFVAVAIAYQLRRRTAW
jgi:autotransporter-associated beta strand protein